MKYLLIIVTLMGLVGCQTALPEKDPRMAVAGHIDEAIPQTAAVDEQIPPVVSQVPVITAPKPAEKLQTFTVVAADLPASELLFALARDARLNLDIDPAISGNVSINAIDQTLPQILKRISNQVNLRYYMDGPNLVVKRDLPFMRTYSIDYLNMARESKSSVAISSKVATGGSVDGGSNASVSNTASNNFWKTLESNLAALAQTGGVDGQVIANRETGTINVLANSAGHKAIQAFLDTVLVSARRQVLIEATVVEVTLNDNFQAGVDWSSLVKNAGNGWNVVQSTLNGNLASGQFLAATFTDKSGSKDISASIKALDAFGNVSVMSSPKIMALNNQTSVLKVVDNLVYFSVKNKTTAATATSGAKDESSYEIHTVPVGFTMNVTPFITSNDEVILNIKPTISRILKFIDSPVINGTSNPVPQISVREMESVLRVSNGNTAVIGGLMQDSTDKNSAGVPGLHDAGSFGVLFGTKERKSQKTELVIFLRPRIIGNANLETNLQDFKRFLKPKLLTE